MLLWRCCTCGQVQHTVRLCPACSLPNTAAAEQIAESIELNLQVDSAGCCNSTINIAEQIQTGHFRQASKQVYSFA